MKLSEYIDRFYSNEKRKGCLKQLADVIKKNYELYCKLMLRKKCVYDIKID